MPHKDPAQARAYSLAWGQKNKTKRQEASKRYYQENKERIGKRIKTPTARQAAQVWRKSSPKGRVINIKGGARTRGLAWDLPKELALDLVTDSCYYCGTPPDPCHGIDRVDNSRGYVEDNVVTCCRYCNMAKHTRTKEEYETWLIRAANHLSGKRS